MNCVWCAIGAAFPARFPWFLATMAIAWLAGTVLVAARRPSGPRFLRIVAVIDMALIAYLLTFHNFGSPVATAGAVVLDLIVLIASARLVRA